MTTSAIVYTWHIAQLERETSDGYVYVAHYTIEADDGTYRSSAYGSIGLQRPEDDELIPYSKLTEELVLEWVRDALGGEPKVTEIQAALEQQINEQRQPSKAQGLPWSN